VYAAVNGHNSGQVEVNLESCNWFNVIGDFLFRELRDSPEVKRSVQKGANHQPHIPLYNLHYENFGDQWVNSVYKSRYKAKYRVQYIAQLQIILSCRWLLVVSSLSCCDIVPTTVSKHVLHCVIMAAIPTVIFGSEIKTSVLVLQPGKTIHYNNTFL